MTRRLPKRIKGLKQALPDPITMTAIYIVMRLSKMCISSKKTQPDGIENCDYSTPQSTVLITIYINCPMCDGENQHQIIDFFMITELMCSTFSFWCTYEIVVFWLFLCRLWEVTASLHCAIQSNRGDLFGSPVTNMVPEFNIGHAIVWPVTEYHGHSYIFLLSHGKEEAA